MKTKLVLLLLLPVLAGNSCKKDKDDGLTPETQIGANTFSCKIDGENFIAKQGFFGPKPAIFEDRSNSSTPSLRVEGTNTAMAPYVTVEIKVFGEIKTGITYDLGGNSTNYGEITYRTPSNDYDIYQTGIGFTGHVTFNKIDRASHIYSGTFMFSASNGSKGRMASKGRFDVGL